MFWCVLHNSILTKDILIIRGTAVDPLCSTCSLLEESISHAFLHCPHALQLWFEVLKPRPGCYSLILTSDSVEELLIAWPKAIGLHLGKGLWEHLPYAVIWTLSENTK
ncbi:hypothetical protein FRX31_012125 [Thalictrum thalictroides]|uniref:Reverse transcriptase zinc-binding domain-containing protein n=1 Tax=Thalictrum thalictroides TaxID=46969 RepID=A0A7J6WLQ2_THATH|nr:hypothetical protein FRX31_012125 [Thalictrum thalictroides]